MKTYEELEAMLVPWTPEHRDAAQREGWDLFAWTNEPYLQIQRIDDWEDLPAGGSTYLPDDMAALLVVRTGTGEHHSVVRKLIHDHSPEEWAALEQAAACAIARD